MNTHTPWQHELLDQIYQSALDPALRPGILQTLCNRLGMTRAMYWTVFDLQSRQACWVDFGCETDDVLQYRNYYHQHDLWVKKARQLGLDREGALVNSDAIVPLAELKASEIYNDSLRRAGVERALTIGIGQRSLDDALYMLTLHADSRHGEFRQHEIALLQQLGPHFARANKLGDTMQLAQARQRQLADVLDQLDQALLICDQDARLDVINRAAERWLRAGYWARTERQRLVLLEPKAQAQLLHYLRQPPADWHGAWLVPIGADHQGQTEQVIRVTPLPAEAMPHVGERQRFLLSLRGPASGQTGLWQALFRLTDAEARLAGDLVAGWSMGEIAENRQLSIHTVRSTLKIVFSKTGCRRQAELSARLQQFL